ncbi:metalloproteinase inhibitor 3-like [Mytilus californianus]|uniref:metalloproteinase inhibitor 3-like n=1 Tax=Mytilus californianus TaxID=6549 RepID=UPI0022453E24|nr:metalloproteinase inhibitor 3-like [Mytilus californianus]
MRTGMIQSCFLLILLFSMSEQCGCPAQYTQQVVCDSKLVVVAKVEAFASDNLQTNYQISVTKFYYGKMEYDKLSDKKTLETPKSSAECGPVVLSVGSSYILSVSLYNGKMSHNLCGLQVKAKSASQVLLKGLAGKYKDNCDCEIPYEFDPPQTGPQTKNQCRLAPRGCSYQSVCSRDGNGRCKWQGC